MLSPFREKVALITCKASMPSSWAVPARTTAWKRPSRITSWLGACRWKPPATDLTGRRRPPRRLRNRGEGHRFIRQAVLVGPPHGRAGRALRQRQLFGRVKQPPLGPAQQHAQACRSCPQHRQTRGRLLRDLKARGLLEEPSCGAENSQNSFSQNKNDGITTPAGLPFSCRWHKVRYLLWSHRRDRRRPSTSRPYARSSCRFFMPLVWITKN